MKDKAVTWLLGFGMLTLAATQVQAQGNCAPRQMVIEQLAQTYGETRQSMGLGASGQVVEVFASGATGTWTITVTMPNGMTCLVASGGDYTALAEALPPEGDPA
ncbi:MAG: hypothetical protein EP307_12645 [Rhodobacteraceae bacterium]|nr:MAG: hypothetical protein EP307_12645 [Paracoccaceae bacterium]